MRVLHHYDENKEFLSSSAGSYDDRMPLLLLALTVLAAHRQIALTFTPATTWPPRVVAGAVGEAADLWAPYGVAIVLAESAAPPASDGFVITVAADLRQSGERTDALAAVAFAAGRPCRLITVFTGELLRVIEATRFAGASEWQWPRLMRERIMGRALGRVLAHEIGHILLDTRQHATVGLMRPAHGGADLIAPERSRFVLVVPTTTTVARKHW